MTTKLKTIKEEASVRQAPKKMKEEDVSSLVVVNRDNDNKPVGLVTERDIVRKVCANESIGNIDAIRIVDIISSPLITINSDSSPKQAADVLLQNKINMFENNNAGNNNSPSAPDFQHSMSDITLILSLIPFIIFVWLAIRSKSIKAFQFQLSVFIAVYILGEIIESNRIAIFSVLPRRYGSQIHVGSAIFFTIMVWFRFYYAEKSGKKIN